MVWLQGVIDRLHGLTFGLMQAGARMLDFEHAMTYVEELGRYSDYVLELSEASNASLVREPLQIYDRIKAGTIPNQPVYDVAHLVGYNDHYA